ncbi:MAG TPA: hypothetical protein VIC06_04925 [Solirubrobacteraceae bacterium]|jgi:predicted lipid-binding transport protein (Tim44 family)
MAEKKAKKDKDAKKKGKKGTAPSGEGTMSIAAHPRAARRVAQAKGWGGLLGFLAGGYLSLSTHTLAEAGFRALVAGVVCYAVVWRGAVFLWRHLVVAELRSRQHELLQAELARIGAPTAQIGARAAEQGTRTQVGATS